MKTKFGLSSFLVGLCVLAQAQAQPSKEPFDGMSIFRYDTFGNEQLWTKTLKMQDALQNVSPATALSVGLKVDSEALPPAVIDLIKAGRMNLNDPAITIQLLKLDAVVGVVGRVISANDKLASVGISCALCH